jgi:hypothetical protein
MGWRTRERGRPRLSTVATLAQTMAWAIATNAGATVAKSYMALAKINNHLDLGQNFS